MEDERRHEAGRGLGRRHRAEAEQIEGQQRRGEDRDDLDRGREDQALRVVPATSTVMAGELRAVAMDGEIIGPGRLADPSIARTLA